MILSGREIVRHMGEEIIIDPFDPKKVNPNSYNLTLSDELMVYDNHELDMKKKNTGHLLHIPEEGILLEPNKLYLGRTREYTKTKCLCRCWKEDLLSDGLVSSSTLRQGSAM